MYLSRSQRSTRTSRGTTSSGRRSRSSTGRTSRRGNQTPAPRGPVQKWVRIMRPPGPNITFRVPIWVPLKDLTEDEKRNYDAEQKAREMQKKEAMEAAAAAAAEEQAKLDAAAAAAANDHDNADNANHHDHDNADNAHLSTALVPEQSKADPSSQAAPEPTKLATDGQTADSNDIVKRAKLVVQEANMAASPAATADLKPAPAGTKEATESVNAGDAMDIDEETAKPMDTTGTDGREVPPAFSSQTESTTPPAGALANKTTVISDAKYDAPTSDVPDSDNGSDQPSGMQIDTPTDAQAHDSAGQTIGATADAGESKSASDAPDHAAKESQSATSNNLEDSPNNAAGAFKTDNVKAGTISSRDDITTDDLVADHPTDASSVSTKQDEQRSDTCAVMSDLAIVSADAAKDHTLDDGVPCIDQQTDGTTPSVEVKETKTASTQQSNAETDNTGTASNFETSAATSTDEQAAAKNDEQLSEPMLAHDRGADNQQEKSDGRTAPASTQAAATISTIQTEAVDGSEGSAKAVLLCDRPDPPSQAHPSTQVNTGQQSPSNIDTDVKDGLATETRESETEREANESNNPSDRRRTKAPADDDADQLQSSTTTAFVNLKNGESASSSDPSEDDVVTAQAIEQAPVGAPIKTPVLSRTDKEVEKAPAVDNAGEEPRDAAKLVVDLQVPVLPGTVNGPLDEARAEAENVPQDGTRVSSEKTTSTPVHVQAAKDEASDAATPSDSHVDAVTTMEPISIGAGANCRANADDDNNEAKDDEGPSELSNNAVSQTRDVNIADRDDSQEGATATLEETNVSNTEVDLPTNVETTDILAGTNPERDDVRMAVAVDTDTSKLTDIQQNDDPGNGAAMEGDVKSIATPGVLTSQIESGSIAERSVPTAAGEEVGVTIAQDQPTFANMHASQNDVSDVTGAASESEQVAATALAAIVDSTVEGRDGSGDAMSGRGQKRLLEDSQTLVAVSALQQLSEASESEAKRAKVSDEGRSMEQR